MYIAPRPLSSAVLQPDELKSDCTAAEHFEDCGLGKKAVYLEAHGIGRRRYIPLDRVDRVFKRLAVSKGYFEQGQIFGSIAYLVVQYEGTEKKIRFNNEDSLNEMLSAFRSRTGIAVGKV